MFCHSVSVAAAGGGWASAQFELGGRGRSLLTTTEPSAHRRLCGRRDLAPRLSRSTRRPSASQMRDPDTLEVTLEGRVLKSAGRSVAPSTKPPPFCYDPIALGCHCRRGIQPACLEVTPLISQPVLCWNTLWWAPKVSAKGQDLKTCPLGAGRRTSPCRGVRALSQVSQVGEGLVSQGS